MRAPCHHGIAQLNKPWHVETRRLGEQICQDILSRDMSALDQLAVTQHIDPVLSTGDVLHFRPTRKLLLAREADRSLVVDQDHSWFWELKSALLSYVSECKHATYTSSCRI
jgi:hypothetical protein